MNNSVFSKQNDFARRGNYKRRHHWAGGFAIEILPRHFLGHLWDAIAIPITVPIDVEAIHILMDAVDSASHVL